MKKFKKVKSIKGTVRVPSDKSISHRSFMLLSMAKGRGRVIDPLLSADTKATMAAMRAVGVQFEETVNGFVITSDGYQNFKEPSDVIDCMNSGTSARLLTGVFAPTNKYYVLTGDNSMRKRPMDRVILPLTEMGAKFAARDNGSKLPLTILPSVTNPVELTASTKSAQVKSAILLAGVQTEGVTTYTEKAVTRNHTEIMLSALGANLTVDGLKISVEGAADLRSIDVVVPGDFSSAAFFLGGTLMFDNSELILENVGLNPTRSGMLNVLTQMGVKYEIDSERGGAEKLGDICIKSQSFEGCTIDGDIVANMIDELPMVATLGLFANSPVTIRNAKELRVKESDRIEATLYNLRQLGAEVEEYEDGMKVYPIKSVNDKAELKAFDDHRMAMIAIMLAKRFGGNITVDDMQCVDVSFPTFIETFESLEQ
ncbi:3-phosphoshikimate 1-carboxyvinyltransferase [Denitrovibrio acetiphilus DSM 12809]|uniref:3-phosphoshikimate 1-carboxyvinyltransferase n=1 Tax=Denitrovibrio acetiphilus (strain DSM 12809 / NBRC 114555 / N2460) TaxID=522772 RepID=D4H6N0_DENA2|nr:3-phosphoshikimate 1-carboxyvinyltransferase [Denitrovibrio acetiphilus]ADD69704.1 3-phosphoshikimate 1-carboxyvinyltransferase [Denitrovibrio acetiphilus DSM 12809]